MDAEAPLLPAAAAAGHGFSLRPTFSAPLAALLGGLLALLAVFGEYAPHLDDDHVARYHHFLTDVRPGAAPQGVVAVIVNLVVGVAAGRGGWIARAARAPRGPRAGGGGTGRVRGARPPPPTGPLNHPPPPAPPPPRPPPRQVYVMIFLGFGLLMTFLRRYSLSAVALNFVLSAVVMLEALLCVGWAQQGWGAVAIDLPLLTDAAFAAGAGMISFGALLGKASPGQLLGVLAAQVPVYAAAAQLAAGRWGALDVGGSITIHAFGAFYGLAASAFLSPRGGAGAGGAHPKNGATRASDLSAMGGTLFLFIFWPSFNSALASGEPGSKGAPHQALAIMNTALALLGACCAAFAASPLVTPGGKLDMVRAARARGRVNLAAAGGGVEGFGARRCGGPCARAGTPATCPAPPPPPPRPAPARRAPPPSARPRPPPCPRPRPAPAPAPAQVHVQNATLAGGVAMGSAANLAIPPAAALGLGALAGALSVAGYAAASPALDRLGVTDTCGVLNLHGMPGVLGGLASAAFVAVWGADRANAPLCAHGARQPLTQLAALAAAVGAALAGGGAAGFAASRLDPARQGVAGEDMLFEDAPLWHLGEGGDKDE